MRRSQPTLSPVPVVNMLAAGNSTAPPPPLSPFSEPADSPADLRGDSFGMAAALPRVRRPPVSPFQGAAARRLMDPGRPAEDPFPLSEVRRQLACLGHAKSLLIDMSHSRELSCTA